MTCCSTKQRLLLAQIILHQYDIKQDTIFTSTPSSETGSKTSNPTNTNLCIANKYFTTETLNIFYPEVEIIENITSTKNQGQGFNRIRNLVGKFQNKDNKVSF